MAHVGGHRVDPALVAVQPDHVVAAALVRPEVLVEAPVQLGRFALEAPCEPGVADNLPGQLGDTELRVVDVALDLRGCDRRVRDGPVGELDTVPGVLPALVVETLGRPRLVLDVAVRIAIAVPVDPGQRSDDVAPPRTDELVLSREAPGDRR
jgi:hypothetical protein